MSVTDASDQPIVSEPFHRAYRLRRATPSTPEGTQLTWDVWSDRYRYSKSIGERASNTDESFSREVVISKPEWFEPIGEPVEFYPEFPKDFSEHVYLGELRHNKMCRFCSLAESIFESQEYKDGVRDLFQRLYDAKYRSR